MRTQSRQLEKHKMPERALRLQLNRKPMHGLKDSVLEKHKMPERALRREVGAIGD